MDNAQPNILLITTDQQRYDTTGETRPSFLRTPHLDQLAREGITFRRAYTSCPLCVPSRISIMTGKSVTSHGMTHNGATSEVMGRDATLPALMRARGYQTAAIGKMHFSPQRTRHGFDEMILPSDYYRMMGRSGQPLQPMRHGLGQNEIYPSLSTVPESQTLTSWTAEQCVEYIARRRDPAVPFFLWCSFSKPHPPLDPPEPYYSMYRDSPIPEPVIGTWRDDETCPAVFRREQTIWGADRIDPEVIRAARAAYFGLITQIDYHIGRLFAALHETGTSDETMILFASDHGEFLGDHRAVSKTYFHEAAAHVPLVLRLPQAWDDRHHGDTCDALVELSDILPTCVAAAGTEAPADIDGIDLAAVARGQHEPRDYVEATVARRDGPHASRGLMRQWGTYYRAITDGRWKYIWYPEGGCEQLFDLESDPNECSNVCDQHPDHTERLRGELERRHGILKPVPELEIDQRDLRNFYRLSCLTEETEEDIRH